LRHKQAVNCRAVKPVIPLQVTLKRTTQKEQTMSKLYFRYGAMNSGKSTALLQVAHNYEERDQAVLLVKPAIDTKGNRQVVSRLGVRREVDVLLSKTDSLRQAVKDALAARDSNLPAVSAVLIDEAQFLTPHQVDEALEVAIFEEIPVLAYGIRTDFQTRSFAGSQRLMEIAHTLEEMKTICRCGRKAIFNARVGDSGRIKEGAQVMIDGESARYEALCAKCFLSD
jgi:thymidine kinase